MTFKTRSTSSAATEQIGEKLGEHLKGGEVIELVSDLGGGKTTFVRGLAAGLGSKDHVASPTFTITRVYKAGNLALHHFDFYRLQEAGIVGDELAEAQEDDNNIVVVEWGGVVENVLPNQRLKIELKVVNDDERELIFSYPESLSYLIPREGE